MNTGDNMESELELLKREINDACNYKSVSKQDTSPPSRGLPMSCQQRYLNSMYKKDNADTKIEANAGVRVKHENKLSIDEVPMKVMNSSQAKEKEFKRGKKLVNPRTKANFDVKTLSDIDSIKTSKRTSSEREKPKGLHTKVKTDKTKNKEIKEKDGNQEPSKKPKKVKRKVRRRFYHRIDPFSVIVTIIIMSLLQIGVVCAVLSM